MGTNTWEQKVDIKAELFEDGSKFSFVQALRLLELESDKKLDDIEKKVRVHPRLSLDFPNSDIVDITQKDDITEILVTFMGLYGESSPLPVFYTEALLAEELEDSSVMRDFINIFNIPMYQLYFRIWLKNRLGVRLNEFKDSNVLRILHSFSGMPTKEMREKYEDNFSLLRYASLNMQFPRSAEAMRNLVTSIVKSNNVEIVQCVERMAPIPKEQQSILGTLNNILGDTLHLGDKIKDRMGKFRIVISKLSVEKFNHLLPEAELFKELVKAITIYLNEPLDWDIQLILKDDAEQYTVLGAQSNSSRLGLNTWLGNSNKQERTLFLNTKYKVD